MNGSIQTEVADEAPGKGVSSGTIQQIAARDRLKTRRGKEFLDGIT